MMSAVGYLLAGELVFVPFAVTPRLLDSYRLLKESLARTEGIVAVFLLAIALVFGGTSRLRTMLRARAVVATLAAILAWGFITTMLSTHRLLSIDSYITCITSALVFIGAWFAAPRVSLVVLDLLIPVVLINTVLVALQEYGVYDPFPRTSAERVHMNSTGFIDNPNVVGAYMTLAAILFASAALKAPHRRWLYAIGAIAAIAGVLVSSTMSALIALLAGLLLLAIGRSFKRAALILLGVIALVVTGAIVQIGPVTRLLALPEAIATSGLEGASSYRVAPVLAALEMFRDHPVTGVGPGAFKFHYMRYKSRVMQEYPQAVRGTVAMNFGEVHNDHAQLLAEAGLPGYLLFLGAIAAFVHTTRGNNATDARQRVASTAGIALAVTLLVLAIAQFPLYVPATRHLLMTVAGLLIGWSRP